MYMSKVTNKDISVLMERFEVIISIKIFSLQDMFKDWLILQRLKIYVSIFCFYNVVLICAFNDNGFAFTKYLL